MINRELLRTLRADIDAALVAVAAKHGLLLQTGRCTFTDDEAKFTLQVTPLANSARQQEGAKLRTAGTLVLLAALHPELDPKATYLQRTKRFKIVGHKPTASKNSIIIADQNGKRFVVSPEVLARWEKA